MSLTKRTILLGFHTFSVDSFVLGQIVITLFTLCTCQCDLNSHNFHLHFQLYAASKFGHHPIRVDMAPSVIKKPYKPIFAHEKKDRLLPTRVEYQKGVKKSRKILIFPDFFSEHSEYY